MYILGPATHCNSPPNVSNAQAAHYHNATLGETVLYACDNGFKRAGGDSRLSCHLSRKYTARWNGTRLKCVKDVVKGEPGLQFILKICSLTLLELHRCN